VCRSAVGAVALGAAILSVRVLGAPRLLAAGLALASWVGLALLPRWHEERLASRVCRVRQPVPMSFSGPSDFFEAHLEPARILFYRDDPTTTVTVKEFDRGEGRHSRAVLNHGKAA